MISVGIRIPPCRPIGEIVESVRRAEALGFDAVWHPDSQLIWREVWTVMMADALSTERIKLGVAATNPVTRDPTVTASAARSIEDVAPGRVRVAIGIGDSAITFAGLAPATHERLRSTVSEVRGLLRGEVVERDEHHLTLRDPTPEVPVFVAAIGPRNSALGGSVGDGTILGGVDWNRQRDRIRRAAEESGRPTANLRILLSRMCVVSDNPSRDARVVKPVCLRVAQLGGLQEFARAGFDITVPPHDVSDGDVGHPEDWDAAVEHASEWIPDEAALWFARTRCIFGSPSEIAAQLSDLESQGVDEVVLAHPGAFTMPDELIERLGSEVLPILRSERSAPSLQIVPQRKNKST